MIRPAKKEDCSKAAALMVDAIHDIAIALTGESNKTKVVEQMEKFFCEEVNRLSYRNCLVKTVGEQPVGIVAAYHGKDAQALDAPILKHLRNSIGGTSARLDIEADPSDYYIDMLSVSPEFGGRGYGTELLQAAIRLAREQGYRTVSLNVEENNVKARKLYERLGFEWKKDIVIHHHTFAYMVKSLQA
ncbi:acetyltransferase (GNAT) family protein [Fontibacillus phaseoli]|uniref:Acetyltransferase (GNAT) family protein n=1 Tax=Fontibacillus phaseoli TaxID=1416533 RepID=A0A369BQZ6_9BACL|nr:GNAT family N-acetyltransferase [Fontibacillus phaseoli]RCX23475.1 acetyltransferase (GNAT) family protein [Fontibacillus phaseoli]